MTNVHVLFNSTPEQRALDCLQQVIRGQVSVRAGWLGYGNALNEIKAQHPGKADERAFGEAVKAAKLDVWPSDGDVSHDGTHDIKRDVRSAAMWAASLAPEVLAECEAKFPKIEVSAKGGFRGLHAAVINEERKQANAVEPSAADVSSKVEASQDAPPSDKVFTAADVEAAYERGRIEGVEAAKAQGHIDPGSLSLTAQQKLETAKRQVIKEIEASYQKRFYEEIDRFVGETLRNTWQANLDHADKISRAHRGVMTKAEYSAILSCLHPDSRLSVSEERLAEAFRIWRSKDIPLLPGADTAPSAPPFPRTAAEMLARKEMVKKCKAVAA